MSLPPLDVPVDPAPPEARRWLIEELAKPEYTRARPTLIDLVAEAIGDWIQSLLAGAPGAPPIVPILIGLLVLAAIVVLAVIFGGRVRSGRARPGGALFGADETRSARELRAAAASAAQAGDWATATAEAFRAIARRAGERELVVIVPGLTAQGFAALAGRRFPDEAGALARAAAEFDAVRYLGAVGSEAAYREVAALDARLEAARPEAVPA